MTLAFRFGRIRRWLRLPQLAPSMIVLGTVAFAATTYAGHRGMDSLSTQAEQRRVAEISLDLLSHTVATLADLERGLRSFLLSGKEDSLEPYLRAKGQLPALYPALLSQLEKDLEPVSVLTATGARLDELIRRRMDLAESHVEARRRIEHELPVHDLRRMSDMQDLSDLGGQALMDEIRAALDALMQLQTQRVGQRTHRAEQVQEWARTLMGSLTIGGMALLLGAVLLLRRERLARDQAEALLRGFSDSLASIVELRPAAPQDRMPVLASELDERLAAERRQMARKVQDQLSKVEQRSQEAQGAHDRVLSFAAELDESIEAERRRLAREVHDQFGQIATGMKMLVHEMARKHPSLPRPTLDQLNSLLDESIHMARRIANELRPPLLDDLGLAAAVTHYAQARTRPGTLDIVADIESDDSLDARQANQLFRVLQEATTNVFRHAQATNVLITGRLREGTYELRVSDNGRGPQGVRPDASGLRNMRERAAMVNGSFDFGPGVRGGADVVVRLPLQVEESV